jgi:hypothetical protein
MTRSFRSVLRWWRLPFWTLALLTGAKSFVDNPLLGSARFNRLGLHVRRKQLAHCLARWRRAQIARSLSADLRDQFDRDGFIIIPNLIPTDQFRTLQASLLEGEYEGREHRQGDTLTRRVAVGPTLLNSVPQLTGLIEDSRWKAVLAYVGATRSTPLYYIQTIAAGLEEGLPDPQLQLHSDTFHPSMKAWLFLTDVADDGRPLTYVAGSHRLTPQRAAWEHRRSVDVMASGDRLSQRGSLRVSPEELPGLDLPPPTRFNVSANTLVAIDTCGFHARADSDHPTLRVEIWAYSRRSPFLPWTRGDVLSWRPLAIRRAEWLASIVDWLDRRGWMVQHWRKALPRTPLQP